MKRGTKIVWESCRSGQRLKITKARGKFTLDEIEDLLRYENNQLLCGHYVIILNCSESTIGGNGCFFEEPKGDVVSLYRIEEGDYCPICGNITPPFEYCPSCGTAWRDINLNVEKLIASECSEIDTMKETDRSERYWFHMGELNMAKLLGFISSERHQELCKRIEHLKP